MIPDAISKLHLHVSQDVTVTHRTGAPNCSFQKISPDGYSDLTAVKTKDFFGKTSLQIFVHVTKGLYNSHCCHLERKIRPASIFRELSAARKSGG